MIPRTFASGVCALTLALGLVGVVQAEVYKCTVNGRTTFSDKPCPSGGKSELLEDKKAQAVPAHKIPTVTATPQLAPPKPAASAASAADQQAPAESAQNERRCFKNKNGHTYCNSNSEQ